MAKRGKESGSGRTALIVAAILSIETIAAVAALRLLGHEPERSHAFVDGTVPAVDHDRVIEVLVLDARLPNARTGEALLFDTEIYMQVRARDEAVARRELDQFANEIRSEMISIWRTSEPHHLEEANLGTLTRRVTDAMRSRFEPTIDGEDIVLKCVVVMSLGYRIR